TFSAPEAAARAVLAQRAVVDMVVRSLTPAARRVATALPRSEVAGEMERLDGIVRGAVGALADELASLAAALGRAAAAYRATDATAARAAAGSAPRRPAVGLAT